MPGLYELFDWLNHQSISTYLVTSSSHYVLKEITAFLKLEHQFVQCFSAYDCRLGKPDPEVYLQAYNTLTIPKDQVLVIEDSLNGLKAAKAAGFTTWNLPEPKNIGNPSFAIADRVFLSHHDILLALKELS
jgi:HAD superfamily hydrolase (TIGR01509 family)